MISNKGNDLLYVEPKSTSPVPLVDELTRKMAAAWRAATPDTDCWRGVHECTGKDCGVHSTNQDYHVGGFMTNSLCVHYVAYHRIEIPEAELTKIRSLAFGEVEPNDDELKAPGHTPARERVMRG